jgi:hypothetical protein
VLRGGNRSWNQGQGFYGPWKTRADEVMIGIAGIDKKFFSI